VDTGAQPGELVDIGGDEGLDSEEIEMEDHIEQMITKHGGKVDLTEQESTTNTTEVINDFKQIRRYESSK